MMGPFRSLQWIRKFYPHPKGMLYVPLSGYENDDTIRSFDYQFKFQTKIKTNNRLTKQLQYQLYKVYWISQLPPIKWRLLVRSQRGQTNVEFARMDLKPNCQTTKSVKREDMMRQIRSFYSPKTNDNWQICSVNAKCALSLTAGHSARFGANTWLEDPQSHTFYNNANTVTRT